MATISEIEADRVDAGARYAAAVTELREAMIELAGHDQALANRLMPTSRAVRDAVQRTFGGNPDCTILALHHPHYAPAPSAGCVDAITARAQEIYGTIILE